jgi:ABC-2 type transport system permease protein
MTTWIPWKIARKELKVIRRRRSIVFYTVLFPILASILFLLVVNNDIITPSGIPSTYEQGLESLNYFYVVMAAVLPSSIAAYSIVGEKIEKSLEPLLATPTTDSEILLGKGIASFVLPIVSIWIGATIFMAGTDSMTHNLMSFYYYPNLDSAIILFLLAPLSAVLSIEVGVIVSSRVNDVRGANQISGLMWVPFIAVFVASLEGAFSFSTVPLLIIGVILFVFDVVFYYVSKSTFNREEILTKWK